MGAVCGADAAGSGAAEGALFSPVTEESGGI